MRAMVWTRSNAEGSVILKSEALHFDEDEAESLCAVNYVFFRSKAKSMVPFL